MNEWYKWWLKKFYDFLGVSLIVVYDFGLTVPTVPLMDPRPIEPDLGVWIVEYIGLKICVKGDRVTVVSPFGSTPVAHTDVGDGGGGVVVVNSGSWAVYI